MAILLEARDVAVTPQCGGIRAMANGDQSRQGYHNAHHANSEHARHRRRPAAPTWRSPDFLGRRRARLSITQPAVRGVAATAGRLRREASANSEFGDAARSPYARTPPGTAHTPFSAPAPNQPHRSDEPAPLVRSRAVRLIVQPNSRTFASSKPAALTISVHMYIHASEKEEGTPWSMHQKPPPPIPPHPISDIEACRDASDGLASALACSALLRWTSS